MLRHFRIAFPFDPCTFPKFHMTTHLPYQILMNGNVREGDAGSGERQHKVFPVAVTPLVLPKPSFVLTAFPAFRLRSNKFTCGHSGTT